MFAAASTSDDELRDELVTRLHAYTSSGLNNLPFNVAYNPSNGNQITGASRLYIFFTYDLECAKADCQIYFLLCSPAQGAMFALLVDQ